MSDMYSETNLNQLELRVTELHTTGSILNHQYKVKD